MTTTPDFKVTVKGKTAYVVVQPNSKTTTSKLDVEARKALPGARLSFTGNTIKRGKPRAGVRVYVATN